MAAVILAWRIAISTIECSGNYGGCALGTLESCVTKNGGIQKVLAAISVCALYWSLDIVFLRQGIYWFAAFFLYVMPVGVLVLAALLYFEFLGGERNTAGNKMTILLLIFAAGWSQEQQAAVTTVFAFLLMLHAIWVKKEKCCAAISICNSCYFGIY